MDEIPEVDRQRLEDMVQTYRHSIYNLYRMAYMQGQIENSPLVSGDLATQRAISERAKA